MNVLILCLIITASIVYIWDWVSFPQEIANLIISKITDGKINNVELKKPLGCSLCMSTWITLVILLIFNWKLAPMCLVFGWSTKYILYLITLIDEFLSRLLMFMEYLINN